jgi:hypothetical protein
MPVFDSAQWVGPDLSFDIVTDSGTVKLVVRAHRLRNLVQTTAQEALYSNWFSIKKELNEATGPYQSKSVIG